MLLYNFVYEYEIIETYGSIKDNATLPLKSTNDLDALSESLQIAKQIGNIGVAEPHYIGDTIDHYFRLLGWHIEVEKVDEDDYKI